MDAILLLARFFVLIVSLYAFLAMAPGNAAEELPAANDGQGGAGGVVGESDPLSLSALKAEGAAHSRFRSKVMAGRTDTHGGGPPTADLESFEAQIRPLLEQYCIDCHGPDVSEGNVRVDALDPDLLDGGDTDWWSEVFGVVTNGEMPPPDYSEMQVDERKIIVEWLAKQLHAASVWRRGKRADSTFRRLTRYEYNYALQDLLGLSWEFAKDLPPEPRSEQGFQNSAASLHLSVSQFETYYRLAREALDRATVNGTAPRVLHWGVSMEEAAQREWDAQEAQLEEIRKKFANAPAQQLQELTRLRQSFQRSHATAYYHQLGTGRKAPVQWSYQGARYAFAPVASEPEFPAQWDCVAVLPAGRQQKLILELGDRLPDEGTMRVTARAARVNCVDGRVPSLQLLFGWQASNEGRALLRVSDRDIPVTGTPENPQVIQWDIPLGEIYPRNSVRKRSPLGALPSPSEYIRIANSAVADCDVQIDFVRVAAPVFDKWPPESHRRIFFETAIPGDEHEYARKIIERFLPRAYRRAVSEEEVGRKLRLFKVIRPQCEDFEEAVLEVLATILSSPQFLYVNHQSQRSQSLHATGDSQTQKSATLDPYSVATKLSLFLWCSIPDEELRTLAESGRLLEPKVLAAQVDRMLADPRSKRFSKHFVHQWLDLELLELTDFERHVTHFDPLLKEAMQGEPIAFFNEMLTKNASVLDFLHANYAVVNERLARHYGLSGIHGNHFRRVELDGSFQRGGLLTQAGLLAMNSDWPDSHPLKRAIWLLECLLDDPPPPPPPAVPQIDLADPNIAKMTLKERLLDHRNQAACRSCHMKIDPWGIAFERYDALGQWRDEIRGAPVDASSVLFNRQRLDGMDGLKRFLLLHRQDQFVQAVVRKLATYAVGRPLGFEDRADIDLITAEVRQRGDGLRTVVGAIVQSDLFLSK